ncbi:DUF1176 domain-containing protein [Variovorax sp. VaC1]|uniref:DUF1176 domain-containing protein n=1 Tax=Variovorax sp. VaC1 TaxID=3373132 RepID=UPI003749B9D5
MKSACIAAAALSLAALSVAAAGKDPVAFSHNDWEIVCDNTRTCRAAGYQVDRGDSAPVSMLITRAAGPATAIEIQLQLGGESDVKGAVRLKVGKASISGLQGSDSELDAGQVRTILPELLKSDEATVTAGGGRKWALSLAGLNAVLLKMDEAQGRIGTPGALVRRGSNPESSVLPSVPMPVVHTITPPKKHPGDDALAARIFPALNLNDAQSLCNSTDKVDATSVQVDRLSDSKVLLSLGCDVGAYNSTSLLWIANDKPPYAPVAIDASGDYDGKDASVTSTMKTRGIGDCMSVETWHFNGKDFVRTSATMDSMCRGFPGGAWSLPRYVSRIVGASSTTPSKP